MASKHTIGPKWLLFCAAPLLIGAKGYAVSPIGQELLPDISTRETGATVTLMPGDVLLENKVAQPPTAHLEQPLNVMLAGKSFAITTDTPFDVVIASGGPDDAVTPKNTTICTKPEISMGGLMAETMAFGLFSGLARTKGLTRACLVDRDLDGFAEIAVLSGAKKDADVLPVKIDPVRFTITRGVTTEDDLHMQVRYKGFAGSSKSEAQFERAIGELGKTRTVYNGKYKAKIKSLPVQMQIGFADFTVLSVDPKTGAAQVKIDSPMPAGPFLVDQPPQYIYVYIPR